MKFQKKKDLKLRKSYSKYEVKQIFSKYLLSQGLPKGRGIEERSYPKGVASMGKVSWKTEVLSSLWQKRLIQSYKIPRQSSKVRVRGRCLRTNRSRSINQLLKLSRQETRRLGLDGQIPGLTRSSW